ncbi:hypothetical protein WR25_25500 [Diploscapter pachys]|uniref:Cadherin domain-containing protein n=1 Tax=Diploscapter pachys TaxID=2018661 RepID=A0A2A2LDD2_9BILA|nr:hypothetical protein WR25_25500 [Diploscapter pachys]
MLNVAAQTFNLDPTTGTLCLDQALDYESHKSYQLVVTATDQTGLSSTSLISIIVVDINDNYPVFYPLQYNITVREGAAPNDSLLIVSASDADAGQYGEVRYSMLTDSATFRVDPETGRLYARRTLLRGRYNLIIDAKDGTGLSAEQPAQVHVTVISRDLATPVFTRSKYEIHTSEDILPGIVIGSVTATGKGAIKYSIYSGDPQHHFSINPDSGKITVMKALDADADMENGGSNHTQVIVYVDDHNDNAPEFATSQVEIMVKEDQPIHEAFFIVHALDKDRRQATDHGIPPKSSNISIILKILDVNDHAPRFTKDYYGVEFFTVDELTGILYVRKEIDRETLSHYNITVVAEDLGKPRLSSTAMAPSCHSLSPLVVSVPGSSDQATNFPQPQALVVGSLVITDPDKGENGTVVYRSQQTHPIFMIKANGDVQLRRPLTDLDPTDYRLAVIASDQGNPRKSTVCHLSIKVMRGNSQVKIGTPLENVIKIPPDCPISCRLKYINAPGVHSWQIQSNEISNHFSLREGWLYILSKPLQKPPYSLTLILSDSQGRQKHVAVRVVTSEKNQHDPIVLNSAVPIGAKIGSVGEQPKEGDFYYKNVNDSCRFELEESSGTLYLAERLKPSEEFICFYKKINVTSGDETDVDITFETGPQQNEPPKFSQNTIEVSIREDTAVGTVVTFVNATVSDSTVSINYRLKPPSNEFFSIDAFTGDVTLLTRLEWNENQKFVLIAEAQCNSLITSMPVIINIVDTNNHRPEILSDDKIYVRTVADGILHRVIAKDLDSGLNSKLKFEIVKPEKQAYFELDSDSGIIKLRNEGLISEDRETPEYLTIRVMDNGQPALFSEQTLEIRVLNETRSWRFFRQPHIEVIVDESWNAEAPILKLENFDHYALAGKQDLFELRANEIYLNLRPKNKQVFLTVLAFSPKEEIDWMELSVRVKSDLKPIISSSSCGSVSVPENQALEKIKRIVATGATTSARFRLQGAPKQFKINEVTGEISCEELDRETTQEHLLVVILEDQSNSDSCTVKITVSDVNDNQPQFASSTPQVLTLTEKVKDGDTVFQFSATDMDIGWSGRVLFDLIEDPSESLEVLPDTGKLILRKPGPPSSVAKSWMIRVKVSDLGSPSLFSEKFIRISDERNFEEANFKEVPSPKFLRHSYISSIDEGLPRGQYVVQVATSPRDSRITYSIVEGNADNAFSIDEEGVVRTALELDREIRENYKLKVLGTGPFLPHISTQISVRVNNVNDNPPSFSGAIKQKKIAENTPPGTYITTLTANDIDSNKLLQFYLDRDEQRFTIDRYSGVIHSLVEFDYELTKNIALKAYVTDGNFTAMTTLKIQITDVNDNAPEFARPFYEITIPPSASVGEIFAKIDAIDADSGDNGLIKYLIMDSHKSFKIDPKDGSLSLTSPLDPTISYLATVTGSDSGSPSLSRSVPVRVRIATISKNDVPVFEQKEFEFSVKEDIPVYSIVGNASNSGYDKSLFYRILDPISSRLFEIDEFGRITLKMPLDRETKNLHRFTIDVSSDASSAMHNSTATVSIIVLDVNDNSPIFNNPQTSVTLKDGLSSGDVIQRLSATDEDIGPNGRISYRILSGNDYGVFSLNPDTGAISFNEWSDSQLKEHPNGKWNLLIEASDQGTPRRSTLITVPVILNLMNWSGTAPFFVVPTYEVHVPETMEKDRIIFKPRPANRFGTNNTNLQFALKDSEEHFSIDSRTGELWLRSPLDWETKDFYSMGLSVSDGNGRSAVVPLKIIVVPVDEYTPIFTQQTYTIQIPLTSSVGSVVGQIRAVDADGGIHGQVKYQMISPHSLVSVDKNNGKIGGFPSHHLTLFNSMIVKISLVVGGILVVLLVLLILCCACSPCCKSRLPKQMDSPRKQVYTIARGPKAVIKPSSMKRLASNGHQDGTTVNTDGKASSMTSSVSTNSNLRASSMSNHRSQQDSGCDPDNVSLNSSVTDYLTSLGVNPHPINNKAPARNRLGMIDHDNSLSEYIYARVDDVLPPGPINMNSSGVDPFSSNITVPPRRNPPSFQPLTEIFDEIAEMRNEDSQRRKSQQREYLQIEI